MTLGGGGTQQIRILLVAGHALLGEILSYALSLEPGFSVVGPCDQGGETLRLGLGHDPRVVLLGFDGVVGFSDQLLNEVKKGQGSAMVLAIASSLDEKEVRRLVQSGVRGIIPWERPLEELVRAIRAVAEGQSWFEQEHLLAVLCPGRRRGGRAASG